MKKMIFALLFMASTAHGQVLRVVSSGYVTGAKAVAEYYVNNIKVSDFEDNDFQPSLMDFPDLGYLGTAGSSNGNSINALAADPSNSSQVAYASADIDATWTQTVAGPPQFFQPFIKIESNVHCIGMATAGQRRAEADAGTTGNIFRIFNKVGGNPTYVHATIELKGTAPTANLSDYKAYVKGIWGDSWASASYDHVAEKWTIVTSTLNANGQRTLDGFSLNSRSFTHTVPCYTLIGTDSFTVSQVIVDSTTDPRYPEWWFGNHHLSATALSSGSGAVQVVDAEGSVSAKITPLAWVNKE